MNEFGFFVPYGEPLTFRTALFALLLAYALTQTIGALYAWTFRGLSYSRSFVQALVLGGVVAAMLMLAINNSIAAGLGIAGSLAIIRFRSSIRDPRDMVFVFASMGVGIAAGLRAYGAALLGTAVFSAAAVLLNWTNLGTSGTFTGLLRFALDAEAAREDQVKGVLQKRTRHFALVTLHEVAQGRSMEYAYQVQLRRPDDRAAIVHDLKALEGVHQVHFLLQEPTVEL